MTGGTQENAMTEIALAMAMGFFSVMVLTAMSMGVSVPAAKAPSPAITTALVADSGGAASGSADKVTDQDVLVIYDGTRFLGRDFQAVDPAKVNVTKRVVLAVTPEMSMSDALRARKQFAAERLVITTLDAKWRRALEERSHGR